MENSKTTTDSFLPENYEAPTSGGYMKFKDGENRLRVLSKPIIGWLDWDDKRPVRFPYKEKPAKPFDPKKQIKHFWAFIVYNYNDKATQILEVTQSSLQQQISVLSKDEDWGSPFEYDLKINRSGKDLETKYGVIACPKKPLAPEIMAEADTKPINLQALFEGGDPYQRVDNPTKLYFQDLPF